MSQRTDRLNSQIQVELMQLMQREMTDPRLGFATVTRVGITPDLSLARVWVSVYGPEADQAKTISALTNAAGWLRHRLGERMTMRQIPRLEFHPDASIAEGDRVLTLLRDLDNEGGTETNR